MYSAIRQQTHLGTLCHELLQVEYHLAEFGRETSGQPEHRLEGHDEVVLLLVRQLRPTTHEGSVEKSASDHRGHACETGTRSDRGIWGLAE